MPANAPDNPTKAPDPERARVPQLTAVVPLRRVDSGALFRGASELLIEHRDATYRLRQTALGKLILTK